MNPWRYIIPGVVVVGLVVYAVSTVTHHAAAHHPTPQARSIVKTPQSNKLPAAPSATAPLTAREKWIIEISTQPEAKHILRLWDRLGHPPLYWSPSPKEYYFWISRNTGNAMELYYTYMRNPPAWYGHPLKP